jgi:hypothetical protein
MQVEALNSNALNRRCMGGRDSFAVGAAQPQEG